MSYKEHEVVYAILRFDFFHDSAETRPEVSVTIKEVVRSAELATAEVARLNALNSAHARYWWQGTKLFPPGKSASSSESDLPNS